LSLKWCTTQTRGNIFSENQKRTVKNSPALTHSWAKLRRIPKRLLFLFAFGCRLVWLRSGNGGHYFIECFLRRHLFAAPFVLAVFMLAATGAASRFEHLFAHHGDNGVVRCALAARTVIVNIIAQSHGFTPPQGYLYFAAKMPCCL
jgi:hypothetical protein